MKALAQLGTGAHIAIAIVFTAMFSGRAAYTTLYPSAPISVWEQEDMFYHPYASVAGAMFPGIVAGLVIFAVLRWLGKKDGRKISN